MMKNKLLSTILFITATFSLSACSLFNDDDIAIKNSYNPVVSEPEEDPDALKISDDIVGHRVDAVPKAYCFKNIGYANNGVIPNTYKTGGANENSFNPNGGKDYTGDKTSNNYDLYVPDEELTPRNGKHVVILFIHGGAWVSGFKTDVNPYVHEFARKGYITATIKYTLLNRNMDDPSLSIFRNLDEIDACIASIKNVLAKSALGFDTTKTELVIGGASSGSHLAMLYTYSRGQNCPISPIKFVVNAVGPTDIKKEAWASFKNEENGLNQGLEKDQVDPANLNPLGIAGEKDAAGNQLYWDEYQTIRIANGMCGMPSTKQEIEAAAVKDGEGKIVDVSPNAATHKMTDTDGGEDQLSVTYWLKKNPNKIKMVAAYAGKDTIVGVNQFATLQSAFEDKSYVKGTDYKYTYFKNCNHTQISAEADTTAYEEFVNNIDAWCKA